MNEELLILGFENSLDSLNPEKSPLAFTGRACPAREGGRGFRFSAEEKEIRKSKSRITKLSDKMGKKFILFKKEIQMSEEWAILGFENSLNSEKSLISANSSLATGRAGEREILNFKLRTTNLSEKMGKKFILFKKEIQKREEWAILGFANSLNSEKSLISANSLNPLNPEKSLNSANSSLATGRAGEREIRKSKSRITKIPEMMGKKIILFKEEIHMREELPNPGFENSLNSEKSLISANSLNPLNPENSLNSANSPLAAAATGRACPARAGGRGFRFRAEEKEIQKSKSRITKFSEKKGKNEILYKRKSA